MNSTTAKGYGVPNELQTYFRDINQAALLSAAEERDLAEAIARGDQDARRRMIEANLRLVVKIARDYLGRGMLIDDLIGEGNLGLIRAAEEFDPAFGTRFSTYASYWIKQGIRHALINTATTIRLPAHMFGLLTKWRRAERLLCRERGVPRASTRSPRSGFDREPEEPGRQGPPRQPAQAGSSLADEDSSGRPMSRSIGHAAEAAMEITRTSRDPPAMDRLDERERLVDLAAVWTHGRISADTQGDRSPHRRDPGMGPQDRAAGREQAGSRGRTPILRVVSANSPTH